MSAGPSPTESFTEPRLHALAFLFEYGPYQSVGLNRKHANAVAQWAGGYVARRLKGGRLRYSITPKGVELVQHLRELRAMERMAEA